jgi:DNA-binding IclR family transcriptional regulator
MDIPERAPSARPLSTLQRGLKILEALAKQPGELTAKQLSKELDVRQGTCYHLLRTLQEGGYVVRLPDGRYDLNGRVAFLQDSIRSRLTPDLAVLTSLRDLHEQVNETACVCGWYREQMVVQSYLEPKRALHARSLEIGYGDNAHARASTRAILAFMPEQFVRAYLTSRSRPKLTPNTITDMDAIVDELKIGARRGFSEDREELARGVCCLGAGYFDENAFPVGSFGISVPLDRFEESHEELVGAVVSAARNASSKLGYSGHFPPAAPMLSPGSSEPAMRANIA